MKNILLYTAAAVCYAEDTVLETSHPSEANRVTSLPLIGEMEQETFSGFIDVKNHVYEKQIYYLHYKSRNDPVNDPTIIWFNGGPGCSSVIGNLQEHGPFIIPEPEEGGDESGDTWEFKRNPWSWNNEANIFYIDQPAGVGYTQCKMKEGHTQRPSYGKGQCPYNDESAMRDTYKAVLELLDVKFPELRNNELYLTGESYGGIYVPNLLKRLDQHIEEFKEDDTVFKPNLKGMAVINGMTNYTYEVYPAMFQTAYTHYIISEEDYKNYTDPECQWQWPEGSDEFKTQPNYLKCISKIIKFQKGTAGLNIYNMYGKCYNFHPKKTFADSFDFMDHLVGKTMIAGEMRYYKKYATAKEWTPWAFIGDKHLKNDFHAGYLNEDEYEEALTLLTSEEEQEKDGEEDEEMDIPQCDYGKPPLTYLNRADVRKALNIPDGTPKFHTCTDEMLETWVKDPKGTQDIWEEYGPKYKLLKMSGDVDLILGTQGTLNWLKTMDKEITEAWRPYFVNDQLGGFTQAYENMVLATVKGAGHMIPSAKPREAWYLLNKWIKNEKF